MKVTPSILPQALILEPKVFGDDRGFFMETWQRDRYAGLGLPDQWVQDNVSQSRRGVLRGLHLQYPSPQAKLISVLRGEIYDVAVDVRLGSPTYGQWEAVVLNEGNKRQFYIPVGMAHGFVVLSDEALICYKCTDYYHPQGEMTLQWNDPDLGIPWPIATPQLSAKDQVGLRLRDLPRDRLMTYGESTNQADQLTTNGSTPDFKASPRRPKDRP